MYEFYTQGGRYQFYRILKSYFPEAEAYYNQDHVMTRIGDVYYDITGEVDDILRYLPLLDEPRSELFF